MSQNVFLAYLRRYAAIAARLRRSFVPAVEEFTMQRWRTISAGITDPAQLDRLALQLADMVVRNYSESDPDFQPDRATVLSWTERP